MGQISSFIPLLQTAEIPQWGWKFQVNRTVEVEDFIHSQLLQPLYAFFQGADEDGGSIQLQLWFTTQTGKVATFQRLFKFTNWIHPRDLGKNVGWFCGSGFGLNMSFVIKKKDAWSSSFAIFIFNSYYRKSTSMEK